MVVVVKKPVPKYELGDPLWVKVGSFPHWPAQVVSEEGKSEGVMKNKKKDSFLVQYFGEKESYGWIGKKELQHTLTWKQGLEKLDPKRKNVVPAVEEATKVVEEIAKTKPERLDPKPEEEESGKRKREDEEETPKKKAKKDGEEGEKKKTKKKEGEEEGEKKKKKKKEGEDKDGEKKRKSKEGGDEEKRKKKPKIVLEDVPKSPLELEVLQLNYKLGKARNNDDKTELLTQLAGKDISVDILKSTLIARTVKRLAKDPHATIASLAGKISEKYMADLQTAAKAPKPKKPRKKPEEAKGEKKDKDKKEKDKKEKKDTPKKVTPKKDKDSEKKEKKDKKDKDTEKKDKEKKEKKVTPKKDKDSEKKEKKEKKEDNASEGHETSDSEPEDCEVVPVSTFLAERPTTALLVDDTPSLLKRRSKFGESMLSRRPASPTIVPFERPRIKPIVPPSQPPPKPSLSQLPTEPHTNGFSSNSHSQSSHTSLPHPQQPQLQMHQPLLQPQLQMQQQLQQPLQQPMQQHMPWETLPSDFSDPSGFNHQWELMEQQHLQQQQQQLQILQMQQQQMQQIMQQQTQQPSSNEESAHKSHKDKTHMSDKDKQREKEKRRAKEKQREKEKREKEKREKAKREKKEKPKKEKPQPLDPTTPEYAAKRKEFKLKLSETIGVRLKKYLKAGRISSKEDFKHLARKFTHKIMALEDAKAVFIIKSNTDEKIHGVIDAYFNRHNSYSRGTSDRQTTKDAPSTASSNGHSTTPLPDNDGTEIAV
eukprot:Phypoly_transcript_03688.p1 GENE.Phypoly_transcript_03688~~Phypoly_transcript_03688.p1  ORF type:complete len:762 (-),score=274.03 Phypoly_transcript_03688:39-2324(-)